MWLLCESLCVVLCFGFWLFGLSFAVVLCVFYVSIDVGFRALCFRRSDIFVIVCRCVFLERWD